MPGVHTFVFPRIDLYNVVIPFFGILSDLQQVMQAWKVHLGFGPSREAIGVFTGAVLAVRPGRRHF